VYFDEEGTVERIAKAVPNNNSENWEKDADDDYHSTYWITGF